MFAKHKPGGYIIEAGNWCRKYENFIDGKTVKKCKNEKTYIKKGCAYCKYYSYKVISKKLY
ncbi:hypothetical protein SAMN04244560_02450 [Thermoanaerobacter thermohydrosulfuricus]|uniref:Uncharacterized protein n=1 Tax=Thermoanaerobacter thermohydrosulfuricus TaxID=1516 RepID=A0A1G7USD2_THETY|nr:hypothetical protein [Thermoanaerobacter thermohydrosulfuricus]SDG49650.1 hypothetical protein SAMN04244560_02450 [Thermoanaerobacter thermohydrosulfuricus]